MLTLGGSATCTLINDDDAAHLTIIKHVIKDNGGTADASAFALTATGTAIPNGSVQVTGTELPGVTIAVNAGAYSVSEAAVPGYTQISAVGCSGTLTLGGSATCTITNDDDAAHLTIIKHVIKDNGGTAAASAFALTETGTAIPNGSVQVTGTESPGVTLTVNAGAYNVNE